MVCVPGIPLASREEADPNLIREFEGHRTYLRLLLENYGMRPRNFLLANSLIW